ncbi:MFS transporter [Halomonas binhaiensis]|uniref:MFS transporter n=1 Tax=Halomonas binhaiensis TaxID=2562282 RepID=A0A5C1NEY1_9GAMM|nr:MFS transporter [Halomonas binhaiensis]QEM80988.1 MFS transporter [Halomonas binhaiensis]
MTYRYRIALIFLIGFFIDCINIFMSAIALPDIARELQVSESSITWVANGYILGITLVIPVSNWLSSLFGARLTIMASMLIFSFGAFFSGISDHLSLLVLSRIIQGLGGGLLIPVGQALTLNLFKKHERARISTLVMTVALIAPAISPSTGGAIVDHFSWRWVFLSNIPLSLAVAVLALLWIRPEKIIVRRPDLKGLLLISLSVATLLLGLSLYADSAAKHIPLGLVMLGIFCAQLYWKHYRNKQDPILDLSMLNNSRMRLSVMVYHAVPGVFTGVNLLSIFYLQRVLGWSAGQSGLLMVLYAVAAFFAILTCGRLYNRTGAMPLFFTGIVLHAAGIALLSLVGQAHLSSLLLLVAAYLLMGAGGGVVANTAQTTAMLDFEDESLARASTIWNLNRQLSLSIGAAVFTFIFNLLQQQTTTTSAYHITFLIAAALGLLPLLRLSQLSRHQESPCSPEGN